MSNELPQQAATNTKSTADKFRDRAAALHAAKRFEEALTSWRRILSSSPDDGAAKASVAGALLHLDRPNEALPLARQVIADPSVDRAAQLRLGEGLMHARRLAEAMALFQSMLDVAPDDHDVRLLLGATQMDLGNHTAALAAHRAILDARPGFVPALCNLGITMLALGHLEEGEAACRRAIFAEPKSTLAHFNLGWLLLAQGRMREGWAEYEYRSRGEGWFNPAVVAAPFLGESLQGRSVFVHGEQGNGDYFQFARYVPVLKERGAKTVTLIAPGRLTRLLSTLPGDIEIIQEITEPRRFDLQVRMMSLPHALDLGFLPAPVPYLAAEPDRVARWHEQIGEHGFRIGVAWSGHSYRGRDHGRSLSPKLLAPLARVDGVRLISLLPNLKQDKIDALADGVRIEAPSEDYDVGSDAFLDAAALMEAVDLVVSIDTGLGHLAGALHRPTWIALPFTSEWRWMRGRSDTPWYPTMRLFRQRVQGDWDNVFAEMAEALNALLAARNAASVHGPIKQTPTVPVSWGELLDKIGILELKAERLTGRDALARVHRELGALRNSLAGLSNAERVANEVAALREVNGELWDVEEALRRHETEDSFGAEFTALARSVYKLNDRRAGLKRTINDRLGSTLIEEKSYTTAAEMKAKPAMLSDR